MRTALLILVLSADAGHEHCWHYSNSQHAIACHSDSVCCFCGKVKCAQLEGCYIGPPPGHGPFAGTAQILRGLDGQAMIISTQGPSRDGGMWLDVDGGRL